MSCTEIIVKQSEIVITSCSEVVEPVIRGGVVGETILYCILAGLGVLIVAWIVAAIRAPKEPDCYWHW
ncbi:hypothetical protein EVB55_118 [Rhizobium phage RHph_Y68]|uniref:Uncharacterized protein n=1 Tax=Rhizobium phage RHph_Y68 TaxID=2509787 RepID=A0A7S5QXY1_9CAUD|nr:hypothetical protein PP934_gp118 [Rhizobium phage RHph_Y68]QIG68053.1 hypothetical protein EVB55_118 [Rhizobium phage RHph_Y68]